LSSRRRNRCIAGYVSIFTMQKTYKKTGKMGGLFIASYLRELEINNHPIVKI